MLLEVLYGGLLSIGSLALVIGLFETVGLGLSGKKKDD
jgi:hypothetical protein|tara:strand:+ start:427 stop:540 length:114 start_codon:yes stop_codon:yes gene_type:complete